MVVRPPSLRGALGNSAIVDSFISAECHYDIHEHTQPSPAHTPAFNKTQTLKSGALASRESVVRSPGAPSQTAQVRGYLRIRASAAGGKKVHATGRVRRILRISATNPSERGRVPQNEPFAVCSASYTAGYSGCAGVRVPRAAAHVHCEM